MIHRTQELSRLTTLLKNNPVVAILGARQVGKTTLAKDLQMAWKQPCHCFDLERQSDFARLNDPELALEPLKGLVVLDEIQRRPDLFPLLRVFADRRPLRTRFLVLGSASPIRAYSTPCSERPTNGSRIPPQAGGLVGRLRYIPCGSTARGTGA